MIKTANNNLKDFFNSYNKEQSKYDNRVANHLTNIIMRNNGISEKDFARVDESINKSNTIVALNEELVNECERENKRAELCAELIFNKMLKNASGNSLLTTAKKDKESLTSDELSDIKKKFGNDLECSFAKDDKGYYCYTHRARGKSYETINKIPKSEVEYIGSTG